MLHFRFESTLSKELFDDQLKQTTGPDARELHGIRNTLEHKYLHVSESWANSVVPMSANGKGLGFSIESEHLKAKTLRILKMARSALIQLSLAISVEKGARKEGQPIGLVFPMPLFELEDRHKNVDSLR